MRLHNSNVYRMIGVALTRGGVMKTPSTCEWDCSGGCLSPVRRLYEGKPYRAQYSEALDWSGDPTVYRRWVIVGDQSVVFLDMLVPCRKCEACRRFHAKTWAERSAVEIGRARRSWFGSLTLEPEFLAKLSFEAFVAAERRATDEETELIRALQREATLMFKRARKAGHAFRYCLVVERGEQFGRLHFHMLLHEVGAAIRLHQNVSESNVLPLDEWWKHGFSKFELVKPETAGRAAWYCAKYLTKDTVARVRASLSYGKSEVSQVASDDVKPSSDIGECRDVSGGADLKAQGVVAWTSAGCVGPVTVNAPLPDLEEEAPF